MSDLVALTENEALSNTSFKLPGYNEVSQDRVLKELKGVFKGWDFDPGVEVSAMFKSPEQLESYVVNTLEEIRKYDHECKLNHIMQNGAIMARRWHFGWIINKCLDEPSYGANLGARLAKAAKIHPSYLYQFKAVGERLSMKDAYMLGLHDAGWELVRLIATVADDQYRRFLIENYISSTPDWTNTVVKESARQSVKLAVKDLKAGSGILDSSNPQMLEKAANFSKEAPEFVACQAQLEKLNSTLKSLSDERKVQAFVKAASDCYLSSEAFEAEKQLEIFKNKASESLKMIESVKKILPILKNQLDSLAKLELEKP